MNRLSPEAEKAFAGLRGPGIAESLRDLVRPRGLECVQAEVTSRCMGKCAYCPHTTDSACWKSRDMSLETFAALWPALLVCCLPFLPGDAVKCALALYLSRLLRRRDHETKE